MFIKSTDVFGSLKVYKEQNIQAKRLDVVKSKNGNLRPDEVILSNRSQELSSIVKQIREQSDVREDVVAQMKEKIDSGNYYVSSYDIAGRVIDTLKGS